MTRLEAFRLLRREFMDVRGTHREIEWQLRRLGRGIVVYGRCREYGASHMFLLQEIASIYEPTAAVRYHLLGMARALYRRSGIEHALRPPFPSAASPRS